MHTLLIVLACIFVFIVLPIMIGKGIHTMNPSDES